MTDRANTFNLVIIGSGPAGLSPLLASHRVGQIGSLLDTGVALIERTSQLGGGSIGQYAINSDSSGATFVDCLKSVSRTKVTELVDHPLSRAIAAAGEGSVPLRDVGRFLNLVGDTVGDIVAAHQHCRVFTDTEALVVRQAQKGWQVVIRDERGAVVTLTARHVVLATGGHQPLQRLADEQVGGAGIVERCGDRLIQSGDVLRAGGLERLTAQLREKANPLVAIVGGSTSAAAVAHTLLNRLPSVAFAPGGVTLLYRREFRIYYPDVATAMAEDYTEFAPDDLCPLSGRVFRFAGLRLDSRELLMQARGIGKRRPEPRLALHQLKQPTDVVALQILDRADIVVAAMGYRPQALPVHDQMGQRITLRSDTGASEPLVDNHCRVLDANGAPLAGLFGIGLAVGFKARGALGGEPSFGGQVNGLWLWQTDVGGLIADAVCAAQTTVSEWPSPVEPAPVLWRDVAAPPAVLMPVCGEL